jgi:hypothetical protein
MAGGVAIARRFVAQPFAKTGDLAAVLPGGREGEPECPAITGDGIVRRHQSAGLDLVAEQDRRADRDTVAGNGRGDVQVFCGQMGTEPAVQHNVVETPRAVPQRPPIGPTQ